MQPVNCPMCGTYLMLPGPVQQVSCTTCGHTFIVPGPAKPQHPGFSTMGPTYPNQMTQPAWGQPAPQKKNNKTGLLIGIGVGAGIAVLFLFVIVGVVIYSFTTSADNESAIAQPNASTNNAGATSDGSRPAAQASSSQFGPLIPFARQSSYSPSSAALRYNWPTATKHEYNFTCEADIKNDTIILEGSVSYQGTTIKPARVIDAEELGEEVGEGNGTGFVVRPDGYLVTCAHVVEGAVQLDVILQGKSYPGKVIAMDTQHDLAIVRINANNLSYLTIADSDTVRLAEEVRAFGFPMADVLGESIKITRGTVAGIIEKDGGKTFQLDATVNPGNSGGPFVNEQGHVVGVARSIIAREDIATMSFAVVSNDVRKLLAKNKWKFQAAQDSDQELDGPDLAEHVQRNVALLKVKVGPGGVGMSEKKVVQFNGRWKTYTSKRGSTIRSSNGGGVSDSAKVIVDSMGEVVHCDGKQSLPAFMGPFALLCLERMPDDDSTTRWNSNRLRIIPQTTQVQVLSAPPVGRDYSYGRHRRRPQVKTVSSVDFHPAIEQARYEISAESADRVTIAKRYELETLHKKGELPYAQVTGDGNIVFDKQKKMPVSMEYKGQMTISVNGTPANVAIRLTYNLTNSKPTSSTLAQNSRPATSSTASSPTTRPPTSTSKSKSTPKIVVRPSTPPSRRARSTNGISSAPVSDKGLTKLDLSP